MSIHYANASISFDENATLSAAGSNVYKLVNRNLPSMATRVLLVSKWLPGSQVSIELADQVDIGYSKLAEDTEEISIANQRRVNRGAIPGRLVAD